MTELPVPHAIAKIAPDGRLSSRQKRRFLIEMSLRKQKPGTGSSYEFLRRRTAINPCPDLRKTLDSIPWALAGGVATRAYTPERMTKDLYVLVRAEDGEQAVPLLQEAGFNVISELALPGFLLHSVEGVQLDVLFGDMPWLDEALRNPNIDQAGYPVLPLQYLVVMKLAAARTQDWADVSRMLGLATEQELTTIRETVARYSPEDFADLESLRISASWRWNPHPSPIKRS